MKLLLPLVLLTLLLAPAALAVFGGGDGSGSGSSGGSGDSGGGSGGGGGGGSRNRGTTVTSTDPCQFLHFCDVVGDISCNTETSFRKCVLDHNQCRTWISMSMTDESLICKNGAFVQKPEVIEIAEEDVEEALEEIAEIVEEVPTQEITGEISLLERLQRTKALPFVLAGAAVLVLVGVFLFWRRRYIIV